MTADRILVPVNKSATLRQTVEYAVETALDGEGPGYVLFVYVHPPDLSDENSEIEPEQDLSIKEVEELFNRIRVWASEDAGNRKGDLTVETEQLGIDQYLFSAEDVAEVLVDAARANDVHRFVFDPEYDPGVGSPLLRPLEYELTKFTDLTVEEAPVRRPARRRPLLIRSTPLQVGTLFGVTFLFYQILGGTFDLFDIVTGAISATIVAVGLSRVTFANDPTRQAPWRVLRMAVYIPYLLWEIIKANVLIALVILHPKLPIDPRMTRVRPAVWGGLPVTTLANSITLTPGTLTVRVDGRRLKVHTLIPAARNDLFDSGLERAVRFVFYGRSAMRISSMRERGEARVLQRPADESDGGSSESQGAEQS